MDCLAIIWNFVNTHTSVQSTQNISAVLQGGYQRLYKDYFDNSAIYTDYQFHQRFRIQQGLFLKIVKDIEQHDTYFAHKANTLGNLGLRVIQKITASPRILAYGGSHDATDKYICIGESTASKSLYKFCQSVIELYSAEYL
ncbi:uncharacterized protein PGTG_20817 [Puccinia graminis f. sp. tritici CRL 75-36-700-3]|uniref:Uncharacterized protein n=1 Tax=Puccinia graminis f. sp. tritici (strain CRL 75-36-700-3 / race SCCL) TaxID=418459 RepID=H6QPS1_PUCGT|nr:uncharacterized protein PGTG_20817 [Puccinia graminis f. sp. tritici CRL 75-36-700-3]EHS64118.1 hypothetical protein PGTG_20817 [Puccinia graminis f. sp. tritici CRL 75-36-700-3]